MGINLSEWAEGMLEIGEQWVTWVKDNGGHPDNNPCVLRVTGCNHEPAHMGYEEYDEARTTAAIGALDLCVSAYQADPSY